MNSASSFFAERMIGLWLRMDAARHHAEAVAQQAGSAVSGAVDAFRAAVHGGLLYSDDKLDPLTHAINQAMRTAITEALAEAECLLQVAREARALADWLGDGKTAEQNVAEELAVRAELLVQRLRDFILEHARCGTGPHMDATTTHRLANLWRGDHVQE